MYAKKSLGQNFLQDRKILQRIADEIISVDEIVEIGPGHGELTEFLLSRSIPVISIEKDRMLIPVLRERFKHEIQKEKFVCIEGDALTRVGEISAQHKKQKKTWALVGNIPYYITGHLLRIITESVWLPEQCIVLVQKEVAQRACASVGDMNILAASIGYWATARMLCSVSKKAFIPEPRVDSAVLVLQKKSVYESSQAMYFKAVHILFKQPRKTIIRNCIDGGMHREHAERMVTVCGLPNTARPQDLSIECIMRCAEYMKEISVYHRF